MRKLIISGTNVISGAEYVLKDYLVKANIEKDFVILSSNDKYVTQFYEEIDFHNFYFSKSLLSVGVTNRFKIKPKLIKILNYINSAKIIRNIIKKEEISIVLGNNSLDIIYSLWVKALCKKKFILYVHDVIDKKSLIGLVFRIYDRFVDKYITVSNGNKRHLVNNGIKDNKIEVVYNGLEYKTYNKERVDKDKWIFGFVGQLIDRKDPLLFVEIISKLNKSGILVEGKMVFNHVDRMLLEKIKDKLEDEKLKIELLGPIERKKMDEFYKNIDFLVLTSKKDPFPTTILEAFNNGTPIIGKNIDGVPEMVDTDCGLLFNNIDNVHEIKTFLNTLNYKTMSKISNDKISEKFNIFNKVKKLNAIIKIDR